MKRIKNPRIASIATALLGVIIFVDDYFNCLTVGSVMRPVTDRFKICREKLAWIIDSTAAPICIIVPVSSWAVAVGGYLGEDGFNTFVASIPYNFYALLTIVFVFAMCACGRDFGPMKRAQQAFETRFKQPRKGIKHAAEESLAPSSSAVREDIDETLEDNVRLQDMAGEALDAYDQLHIARNGRVYDLIVPILVLIIFSILGMMYAGGFFQGIDFATAMGENPIMGLCIGSVVALVVAALLYLPRKLLNLSSFITGASEGVRSMVEAIMILPLYARHRHLHRWLARFRWFRAAVPPCSDLHRFSIHRVRHGYFLGNDRACDSDRNRRVHARKPALPAHDRRNACWRGLW